MAIRVGIVGAGISGLALANNLLNDAQKRFIVEVFERDDMTFKEDRQGYCLTISEIGLSSLKSASDAARWQLLNSVWGKQHEKGAALIDPKTTKLYCHLSDIRGYPEFRRISRQNLRGVLRQKPEELHCIRYGCALDSIDVISASTAGHHQVKLNFQNPDKNPSATVDVVVAADGSYSRVNEIVGLNNKYPIEEFTMIQSRAIINRAAIETLPKLFNSSGRSWIFLGGKHVGGFVNVFPVEEPVKGAECDGNASTTPEEIVLLQNEKREDLFRLFCDFNIPRAIGDRIIQQSKGDAAEIMRLFSAYVTDEVKCDPSGIPRFIKVAHSHVRTGKLTSSHEPTDRDWRQKKSAAHGRVILIGDAIHPMPPARGMGANQALADAEKLALLLKQYADKAVSTSLNDEDALSLAKAFDDEMYPRAFQVVKDSEQALQLDLTSTSGRVKLRTVLALFEAANSATNTFGKFFKKSQKPPDNSAL